MSEDLRSSFLPRHDVAHAGFTRGNPEPWLALWSRRDPVSIFGGFGYAGTGWLAVSATFRKASARLAGGAGYSNEIVVAEVAGDHAYTVATESSVTSADGAPAEQFTLRVTQIYRREDGAWKIAHRHADIIRPAYPAAGVAPPAGGVAAPAPSGGASDRLSNQGGQETPGDIDQAFFSQMNAAQTQFARGNPEPWQAMWSERDPVSVFGSFGYASTGWAAVSAAIGKASARLSGGCGYRSDIAVKQVIGDYAYTVAIESLTASADGAPPAEMKLRVTQVYRREEAGWKVAHRHGDVVRPDYAAR
jgi:ketosteroid isomerase-like protein